MTWEDAYELIGETLQEWIEVGIKNLPNFIVAVLIVVIFWILSRIFGRVLENTLNRIVESDVISNLGAVALRLFLIGVGLLLALETMGLQKAALSMLAGAGVVGIALGFAFQETAENFIAGVVMGFRKPFNIGDLIETHDRMGFVRKLNLRNTIIENFDGQRVLIPNREVFQNTLINYQMTGKRRVEFTVGVAFSTDLPKAIEVGERALENDLDFIIDGKAQLLAFAFGDSSIDLKARYWIAIPGEVDYYDARHRGVMSIHNAFAKEGIVIPHPIRTLELNDSIRTLAESEARTASSDRGSEDAEASD